MTDVPDANAMFSSQSSTFNRLIRLRQHSRANIPAYIAQRAASTFTLQQEPVPVEAKDRVLVVVYPQDPFIGEPEIRTMSAHDIQTGLINSRVRIHDDRGEIAEPNIDGNYLYWPGTPQFDQINSFYFTTFTLRMYERYARRALPWAFPSPRITINPHIGTERNAFYSEQEQLLGFHSFDYNGKIASTAWSADIVSHETAHAILDSLRDLHNESFGLGPAAFHESFGDMTAMLVALHDDSLIRRLLEWTEGDLHRNNFVAAVAEHLAKSMSPDEAEHIREHTVYLRNAINALVDQPFDTMPYIPANSETELGRQPHNYSRLFTGAFYDILVGIHNQIKQSYPAHIAIYAARNVIAHLLVCAIELGPVGEFTFADMARAFLAADRVLYDGRHHSIMIQVFQERNILTAAEADAFLTTIENLPDILLPETLNSAMASALFLEHDVAPKMGIDLTADELIPMNAYRNSQGYAYLNFFSSRRISLSGQQFGGFEGVKVDVFGGLTLMFNPQNRLCSVMYRPISDEDIRQIQIMVADLIAHGLIIDDQDIYMAQMPTGILIPSSQSFNEYDQLVKYPTVFDLIPPRVSHFGEYLNKIRAKLGLKENHK